MTISFDDFPAKVDKTFRDIREGEQPTSRDLTITVRPEPGDDGFRATASGHPDFKAAFAEYGKSRDEAIGGLVRSLFWGRDPGAPVRIRIVGFLDARDRDPEDRDAAAEEQP